METCNVFVYCGSESGGEILNKTFIYNQYNVCYLHNNFHWVNYLNNDDIPIFDIIDESCKNKKVYIIDCFRNPLERSVSSFFQNITTYLPKYNESTIDEIISYFNENEMIYKQHEQSLDEVMNYYNAPLFETFDFEKRYNILEKDNKIFIKILFNDLDNWKNILSEIFDKEIKIYPDNSRINKKIHEIYKLFKEKYQIPKKYYCNSFIFSNVLNIYTPRDELDKIQYEYLQNLDEELFELNELPCDFDSVLYKKINNDLDRFTDLFCKIHYILHGKKENRRYKVDVDEFPLDFDVKEYKELNFDLRESADLDAEIHYLVYGKNENRRYKIDVEELPIDFDVTVYKEMNSDIGQISDSNAKLHFIEYGKKENRTYCVNFNKLPLDFDVAIYKEINTDLTELSDLLVKIHFVEHGLKENRKYKKLILFLNEKIVKPIRKVPPTFNWKIYLQLNQDVICSNNYESTTHYMNNGIYENRVYNYIMNYTSQDNLKFIKLNHHDLLNYDYSEPTSVFKIEKYDSFILIIDGYNLKGGTSFFMNTILSIYKNKNNFLIVSNNNDTIEFHTNDSKKCVLKLNIDDSIVFLKKNSHKISKIFINHIYMHNSVFLNELFNLNKIVTIITHDYSGLINNNHPQYEEINKINVLDPEIFDINKCNMIISQNIETLNNYYPLLNHDKKKELILTELPDYRKKNKLITTNNPDIVVGIIGNISDIKGKYVIEKIIEENNYDSKVTFVVFGELHLKNFKKYYQYSNIDELNKLLIQHKPNVLLEASLIPETYSYTLSLAKITSLPILYLNKSFHSVVENRLFDYDKKYSFSYTGEFYELVPQIKQNYFHTISDEIYYSSFWDEYFIDYNHTVSFKNDINLIQNKNIDLKDKNLVFISSKIVVSDNKYLYYDTRSVYTSVERFEQTISTIQSIRKYIPNSYIVLFDNSKLDEYKKNILDLMVDTFINITDNELLNYYTDEINCKLYGELIQYIFFYEYFLIHLNLKNINSYFKISGRYIINKNFNFNLLLENNETIFKINENITDREYFYTSFYKLNKNVLNYFFKNLKNIFENKHLYKYKDWECVLPTLINKKVTRETLGITQIFGPVKKIDYI